MVVLIGAQLKEAAHSVLQGAYDKVAHLQQTLNPKPY